MMVAGFVLGVLALLLAVASLGGLLYLRRSYRLDHARARSVLDAWDQLARLRWAALDVSVKTGRDVEVTPCWGEPFRQGTSYYNFHTMRPGYYDVRDGGAGAVYGPLTYSRAWDRLIDIEEASRTDQRSSSPLSTASSTGPADHPSDLAGGAR